MYLTSKKPEIGKKTENALFDKGIILAGICLFLILSYTFYFSKVINILFN